ncbi:MAG TPA: alpha/beta hydrolase [Candidatus Angelobacter sp.]|nr:alpha/beta hydrolase [Candidatus Angelobacter sp.]
MSDGMVEEPSLPEKPSLRARVLTRVVRLFVKHWPRGDYSALVQRARRLLALPAWLSFPLSYGVSCKKIQGTDICGEWVIPNSNYYDDRVLLYLHGGGYVSCNPQTHRPIIATLSRLLHWRVFALDYRLAPEAPFPAAVDDAARAFSWLTEQGFKPHKIAIAGDSSGGGLVIATMLRLRSRELPLPGCGACLSPWVDLTGEWNYGNAESCAMFRPEDISAFAEQYLNGASPRTPEASPIFADLKGLPPLLIQASSTELLFDEAVRLHEKAERSGVESTLHAYPALPHVWQIFTVLIPEASAALKEIAAFVELNTK